MIHSDREPIPRLEDAREEIREIMRRLPFVAGDVGGVLGRLEHVERDIHYLIQDLSNESNRGNE